MKANVADRILEITGADEIVGTELLQELWSGYGELLSVSLKGGPYQSVILKHIQLPAESRHPKGFDTPMAQQRKLRSYQVETCWYEKFNSLNLKDSESLTAKKLASFQQDGEFFILLEDLQTLGCAEKVKTASWEEVQQVLSWLAHFHAKFLGQEANGLWERGTYWHLDTRPDELKRLATEDPRLWRFAGLIDQRLHNTKYQTIVHGDAKLDNFCFSKDRRQVAAVDFQYVGRGCGMKDVAYFVGSCLGEDDCETLEGKILDHYFSELKQKLKNSSVDALKLEQEWRALYPFAWADFHRFLKGWSPGHWKINSYSEAVCQRVQTTITEELLSTAKSAALQAGQLVRERWKKDFEVSSKPGGTDSAQALTEVDLQSQQLLLSALQASRDGYGLGLLSEESSDDGSRLNSHFFWAIDPLDGTLPFSEGLAGFAVSIALISRQGKTFLGAVHDPVSETLYHAVDGEGCFKNDEKFLARSSTDKNSEVDHAKIHLFADRSLRSSLHYQDLEKFFTIHFSGGAVMNAINTLTHGNACYLKYPKKEKGGCAIWDLAAIHCLIKEAGGAITGFGGNELSFNESDNVFFNQTGLLIASDPKVYGRVRSKLQSRPSDIHSSTSH